MANNVVNASRITTMLLALLFAGAANAFPTVAPDVFTGPEDQVISGNVLDNDTESEGGLIVMASSGPGDLTIDVNGNLTFTPPPNFSGIVNFTYDMRQVDVNLCGFAPDPACIITGVPGVLFFAPQADLPTVVANSVMGDEDTAIPLDITVTAVDPSEVIRIVLDNFPVGSVLSAGTQLGPDRWELSEAQLTGLSVTPPLNFNGVFGINMVVFTLDEATDPNSNVIQDQNSLGGNFNVTVNMVNDDPTFSGPVPSLVTPEDVDGSVSLVGLVSDVDIATNADVLAYVVDSINNSAVATAVVVSETLYITVLPDQHDVGGSITVTVTDIDASAPISIVVPVDVTPANDPPFPTGATASITTDEDVDDNVDLAPLVDDIDIPDGDSLTFNVTSIDNNAIDTAFMSGSTLEVTLLANRNGSGTVTVQAEDQVGGDPVTLVIPVAVTPVNDDPYLALSIPVLETDEDNPGSVDLVGVVEDADIITDSDSVSYAITSVDNAAVDAATMVGTRLDISVLPNAFEVGGTISIQANDENGGVPVDFDVTVNVNPVNDLPTVVGSVTNVSVDEDAPSETIDFSGVFFDEDVATGDTLTLTAVFDNGDAIFDGITMSGTDLILDFTADANGTADVLVLATDSQGESAPYLLPVAVAPVNDAPVAVGALPNRTIPEDFGEEAYSMVGVFTDVDIATDADVLSYEVFLSSNPGAISSESSLGDDLLLTFAPDFNGVVDIDVIARDLAGATSAPVRMTITVDGVNDDPIAADDVSVNHSEDGGEYRVDVLANDYLGDVPTTIVDVTNISTQSVIDINGDTIVSPAGSVAIDGSELVFTPGPDFFGDVSFNYTIEDNNGDPSTAEVTFYVDPVNDAPEGQQTKYYSMFEGGTLNVEAVNGLKVGAYDIDPSALDANGDPLITQPLTVVFESSPDPLEGTLLTTSGDGSFSFEPVTGFIGTTSFEYTIYDSELKSDTGIAYIDVLELPPIPETPNPGEVVVLYNLANTPLEQSASVSPNVLVSMDDSGSMDWHITVDSTDDNGRFVIDNASIATSSRRTTLYTYLFNLNVNSYGAFSGNGRILPSEESLPAGNDYNVWQARSSAFNGIYYNPEVDYKPWAGLDNGNQEFEDADPENIRLDPRSASNLYDITTLKNYTSSRVPRWQTNGGRGDVAVTNFYIPRYYTPAGVRIEIVDDGSDAYPGGAERDDCVTNNDDTCTYDEEIQNFANWFQYYRSRELVAKAAIGNVVAELQDIRVGYETINRRSDEPIADMNEYYWEGDKKELLDTIYDVNSSGGTPLRRALDDAGQILGCNRADRDCPQLPAPEGYCQQNFTLLFSDGYWNGSTPRPGNFDEDGLGPYDGGKYADVHSNTLADIAMYYYENDLFPAIPNEVPLSTNDLDGVPEGTFTSTGDLIHQHMKTFTIAFGVEPDIDPDDAETALATETFNWPSPTSAANAKIDDMLHAAINGRGRFLNAGSPEELQRAVSLAFNEFTQAASSSSAAAFNSTSLRQGTLLYRAFYDLRNRTGELTASTVDTVGVIAETPSWTAARYLDENDSSGFGLAPSDRVIFTYDPVNVAGLEFDYSDLTVAQRATLSENQVDYLRGDDTFEEPSGSLRARLAVEGRLGDIVNSSPIFVGDPRAFNRDQEPYPTSDLYSDFVSSVADRQKVVYVGSNDGMLHGFNADVDGGEELMAYVPNLILDSGLRYTNKLNAFTSPFYIHDYFVDLSPRLNDVYMRPSNTSSKQWITALVGGLGAGGKGYYALNVTDPDAQFVDQSTAKDSVLWEFTEEDDTYPEDVNGDPIGGAVGAILDFNDRPVKDLGYSFSLPIITLSNVEDGDNENHWVSIFGNGANSTSGIATLFILFMDEGVDGWQDGDFVKLTTGFGVPLPGEQLEGLPNALGSPTAVDKNLDGTVDLVYAGDRLGNLWRFDVSATDPNSWAVTRLFTATYEDSNGVDILQPIQSKPLVVKHPEQDGFLITFGTGSFIAEEDGSDTSIQSIYTIWDSLVASPPTAADDTKEERLVQQTITNVVDDSVSPQQTRRIHSNETVAYAPEGVDPGVYGWYIDLDMVRAEETLSGAVNDDASGLEPPDPQFPGEKAVRRFIYRDGVILTTTVLPATNATSCFGSRPGALLIMDGLTGGDPMAPVIDFNQDGVVDSQDLLTVDGQDFTAGLVFDFTELDGQLVDLSTLGGEGATDFLFICGGNECTSRRIRDLNENKTGRLSWTELQLN